MKEVKAMQKAVPVGEGMMIAVLGMKMDLIKELLKSKKLMAFVK